MAKKKAAKAKKSVTKTTAAQYAQIAGKLPGSVPGSVGEHFRARIMQGKLDNEAILKEVRAKHKGCKATMSSLYWNRQYLANHDGLKLPAAKPAK